MVGPSHQGAADIPLVQLENNRHVATAELQSAKQRFEDLRRTVLAMETRSKDAKVQGEEASSALCQLILVAAAAATAAAAGVVLLHQAVGGTASAQLPNAVSGLHDLAGDYLPSFSAVGSLGVKKASKLKSKAERAKDGKF
jgi:hypothetical protein